eukprot:8383361-Lingulodinium_polyedra.AAC.1
MRSGRPRTGWPRPARLSAPRPSPPMSGLRRRWWAITVRPRQACPILVFPASRSTSPVLSRAARSTPVHSRRLGAR